MTSQFWISTSPDSEPEFYLLPCELEYPTGSFAIGSVSGETAFVDSEWVKSFAISRPQAVKWARRELGQALVELKTVIYKNLLEIQGGLSRAYDPPADRARMRDALPIVGNLIKSLPSIIGHSLSSDVDRIATARATMAQSRAQLSGAGIDVDRRFTDFPDRLAKLREDFERERTECKSR